MSRLYIVHIGNYLIQPQSGVFQKYQAIYQAIQPHVHIEMIAFTDQSASEQVGNVEVVGIDKKNKWSAIAKWMRENLQHDDVVWLRYPFACKGLYELTLEFGHQIVFEHNTNEQAEAIQVQKRAWRNAAFGWRKILSKSFLSYTWSTWIAQISDEDRWGERCLRNVKGAISVTLELSDKLKKRVDHYAVFVLPNCISENDFHWPESRKHSRDNNVVRMVMMIGTYDEWQGWERILKSVKLKTNLSAKIELDIYGELPNYKGIDVNNSIHIRHFPAMSKAEMIQILPGYDLGIGTLQLYKKQMNEACPLKVRDYWRFGIPCVMGYSDTALLQHPELKQYNVIVPNDNSDLPWQKMIDFVQSAPASGQDDVEMFQQYKNSITYQSYALDLIGFLFKE
ncbi:MAG: hypothetical protein RL106_1452 [Bacteroidota bacterium]